MSRAATDVAQPAMSASIPMDFLSLHAFQHHLRDTQRIAFCLPRERCRLLLNSCCSHAIALPFCPSQSLRASKDIVHVERAWMASITRSVLINPAASQLSGYRY